MHHQASWRCDQSAMAPTATNSNGFTAVGCECHASNNVLRLISRDILKLPKFGKALRMYGFSTPIHSATGAIMLSQGYRGIKRPR
eukprot:CAMPEP_0198557964 /NCGR_PEP_ID=MMETSP1462-20131121/89666_1 /TAXON_ID=1333877 /ORGANISM="Brandtodinium nutriculum, Strain RCC3387" /LENGTH=84 /DNA_ID=CAMNT_0044288769 /DNA_START=47 /DNA_END=297 /DNA_ORIENTATION=-